MDPFLVKKLLSPGMANPMIGHKKDHCVLQVSLGSESSHDVAHEFIGQFDAIQVGRPILPQNGMIGIVRRQGDLSRVYAFAKQFLHPSGELTALLDIASSMLASGQMDLGEKRLARRPLAPVRIVVHAAIPLEIVIRLAP